MFSKIIIFTCILWCWVNSRWQSSALDSFGHIDSIIQLPDISPSSDTTQYLEDHPHKDERAGDTGCLLGNGTFFGQIRTSLACSRKQHETWATSRIWRKGLLLTSYVRQVRCGFIKACWVLENLAASVTGIASARKWLPSEGAAAGEFLRWLVHLRGRRMIWWCYVILTCQAGPAEGAFTQRRDNSVCVVPNTQVQVLPQQETAVWPEFTYST